MSTTNTRKGTTRTTGTCTGGTTTGRGKTTGSTGVTYTTPELVVVTTDYLTSTLFGNPTTGPTSCMPAFATEPGRYASVSKGILLFAIYREGLYQIMETADKTGEYTQNDALTIPFTFLPSGLRSICRNVIKGQIPEGTTVPAGKVLEIWRDFVTYTLNSNNGTFSKSFLPAGTSITNVPANVSNEVLQCILYREGEYVMQNCPTTGGSTNFKTALRIIAASLPQALCRRCEEMLSKKSTAGAATSANETLGVWKNFVSSHIGEGGSNYVETFSALWPYLEYNLTTSCNTASATPGYGTILSPKTKKAVRSELKSSNVSGKTGMFSRIMGM